MAARSRTNSTPRTCAHYDPWAIRQRRAMVLLRQDGPGGSAVCAPRQPDPLRGIAARRGRRARGRGSASDLETPPPLAPRNQAPPGHRARVVVGCSSRLAAALTLATILGPAAVLVSLAATLALALIQSLASVLCGGSRRRFGRRLRRRRLGGAASCSENDSTNCSSNQRNRNFHGSPQQRVYPVDNGHVNHRRLSRGRPVERLVVTSEERQALQRYSCDSLPGAGTAREDRIGMCRRSLNRDAANEPRVTIHIVGNWRCRFVQRGIDGLR
jgi:hypothetical protein